MSAPARPMVSRRLKHVLKGLMSGLVVALVLLLLRDTYVFQALELKTLDARFRTLHGRFATDTGIVIVDQDEASIAALRPAYGRPPWPRGAWAVVVDYLRRNGAKVIAFDFTFPDPVLSDSIGDDRFAEATARAGNVVQAMTLQIDRDTADVARQLGIEDAAALAGLPRFARNVPRVPAASYDLFGHPYPLLMNAAYALGVVNYTPDSVDGVLRRMPPLFAFRHDKFPTLGLAAGLAADPALGVADLPLDHGSLLIKWKGPYHDARSRDETYRIVPVAQIFDQLQTGDTTGLHPGLFRGKVVFLGTSASASFDLRSTPFGAAEPGIIIHATVADNLLRRDYLRRASTKANVLFVLAVALLAGLAVSALESFWASTAAGLGLATLVLAACWMLFAGGTWLDATTPALAVLFTFTGGMTLNYVTEGRHKRQIRDMFSKYVAPEYVAQLAEDPTRLHTEGHRAELSILFSDIRGFTTISESMSPTEVIGFLNEYLSDMAGIVKQSGGTLDKFIGDAVMAFWGEPVPEPDHAARACDCALAMKTATEALAKKFEAEGKPAIRIGIGINTADVVVGNVGSLEHKLDYTVIGDGVNLASRLEGLNKEFKTTIIISEFCLAKLGGRYETRALGGVNVKGKTKAVEIFELVGKRAQS